MQSFASPPPTPIPHPTKITHHILYHAPTKRVQLSPILTPFLPKNPQKGRNYRLYPRPFYPKTHRKGTTIACFGEKYYYLCKKQINHNYYDKQRINRKSL